MCKQRKFQNAVIARYPRTCIVSRLEAITSQRTQLFVPRARAPASLLADFPNTLYDFSDDAPCPHRPSPPRAMLSACLLRTTRSQRSISETAPDDAGCPPELPSPHSLLTLGCLLSPPKGTDECACVDFLQHYLE